MVVKFCAHTSNSANLKSGTNLCGQSSLGSTQHNIEKFLRRGNGLDILPSGLHGGRQVEGLFEGMKTAIKILENMLAVSYQARPINIDTTKVR